MLAEHGDSKQDKMDYNQSEKTMMRNHLKEAAREDKACENEELIQRLNDVKSETEPGGLNHIIDGLIVKLSNADGMVI